MLSAVYLFFPQKKAKKVYLIAVFVLLTLVMAFRSQQVGVDAAAYCSYYMRIGISDQFMNIVNAAPLYSIYNRLLYYLFPYEQAILVFNAIIVNSCFGYFIYKRAEHPVFSSVCYLLLYTYMNTFNGTRQYIACGLFLVGIIFLQEKKTVRAVLWMIAALGVHQMVFVMLPNAEMDEGKIPLLGGRYHFWRQFDPFPLLSADLAAGGKDAASLPKVCGRTDSLL